MGLTYFLNHYLFKEGLLRGTVTELPHFLPGLSDLPATGIVVLKVLSQGRLNCVIKGGASNFSLSLARFRRIELAIGKQIGVSYTF